jgi:hypothetical protein
MCLLLFLAAAALVSPSVIDDPLLLFCCVATASRYPTNSLSALRSVVQFDNNSVGDYLLSINCSHVPMMMSIRRLLFIIVIHIIGVQCGSLQWCVYWKALGRRRPECLFDPPMLMMPPMVWMRRVRPNYVATASTSHIIMVIYKSECSYFSNCTNSHANVQSIVDSWIAIDWYYRSIANAHVYRTNLSQMLVVLITAIHRRAHLGNVDSNCDSQISCLFGIAQRCCLATATNVILPRVYHSCPSKESMNIKCNVKTPTSWCNSDYE